MTLSKMEETKTADCNAPLTREMLSRYLIWRMGQQKAAALDPIFCYPFADEADTDPTLKGDIAIAHGLGILKGDGSGNFYPKKELTRAEAASVIYHYFQAN